MGVKGLWRLLLPIGRRISIETLEGKVLAVDASIWMTQFLKAMRDPESGAVRPAAHIIGFFRRLCRLRFHGIRPVFVFDGPTPEIKKRELAARRKRRDQFVSTHGPAAIQRMAKKLLVDQLNKTKSTVSVDASKNVKITPNDSQSGSAFAAGFNLPESSQTVKASSSEIQASEERKEGKLETERRCEAEVIDLDENDVSTFEMMDDGVIITGATKPKPIFQPDTGDDNDWDKPIPDGELLDIDDRVPNSDNDVVEYDDVLWNSRRRKRRRTKSGSDDIFDIDFVLSLPPAERKDAIEEAKKRQRMRSRREFMPVAANAEGYSQAQLRNFIRSSKLNQDIVKMAKKTVHQNSKLYGEVTASDRTRRVIFTKDDEEDNSYSKQESESSDDEGSEAGGFLSATVRPTSARKLIAKKQQSPGEKSSPRHRLRKMGDRRTHSPNKDDSDDEESGFFSINPESDNSEGSGPAPLNKRRIVIEDEEVSDQSLEDGKAGFMLTDGVGGGGFMPTDTDHIGRTTPGERTKKARHMSSEGATNEGGFRSKADNSDGEVIIEEVKVSFAARGGRSGSTTGTLRFPASKFVNEATRDQRERLSYAARSDCPNEESSGEDSCGYSHRKSMENDVRFKSTGLESDVIAIDEEHTGLPEMAIPQEDQDQLLAKALQEQEDADAAASYNDMMGNIAMATSSGSEHGTHFVNCDSETTSPTASAVSNDTPVNSHQQAMYPSRDAAGNHTSNSFLTGDDESEEDDIDWENGDVEDDVSGGRLDIDAEKPITHSATDTTRVRSTSQNVDSSISGRENPACSKNTDMSNSNELVHIADIDDDSDSDAIDWQEGADNDVDVDADADAGEKRGNRTTHFKESNAESGVKATDLKDDNGEQDNFAKGYGGPHQESTNGEGGISEHGVHDFAASHAAENAAAFQQAETTASNLTNWAGRAMRRAIAEYSLDDSTATTKENKQEKKSSPQSWGKSHGEPSNEDGAFTDNKSAKTGTSTERISDEHGVLPYELSFSEQKNEEATKIIHDYESELASAGKDNIERETDTVTDEMQEEVMQLLQLFGIPYIQAPAEAEAQCVALEKLGLVNGIVTEDSDVFVFGGKRVYKNMFEEQKYVEVYLAEDAEREMGLGHYETVAMAMLLGGDYSEGLKGVGLVNGMEVVSAFGPFNTLRDLKGGLQKFRKWLDGFEPIIDADARKDTDAKKLTKEQKFHIKHRSARNRWEPQESFPSDAVISAYVNPVVDKSEVRFSWGMPDVENLLAFCSKNIGWPAEETKRILKPVVEKVYSSYHQTRIDSFMRYEDGIKFANIRSKRLRDVLSAVHGGDENHVEGETLEESRKMEVPSTKMKSPKNGTLTTGSNGKDQGKRKVQGAKRKRNMD